MFTILWSGLLVGTLDMAAALIHYVIVTNNDPTSVLKYIASSVYGNEAYAGGSRMVVAGLLIHFCIALSFTLMFFMIYPFLKMRIPNPVITGILYGCFIWIVMNLLVLPLTQVNQGTLQLIPSVTGILILIVAIGIPLSLVARRYYFPVK